MLEFKNVTKKYLRRAALEDVSFALQPGQVALAFQFTPARGGRPYQP